MTTSARFHAGAWGIWLLSTTLSLSMLSNPFALGTALVAIAAVAMGLSSFGPERAGLRLMLKLGIVLLAVRVTLFALTGHVGATTVAVLPEVRLPRLLGGMSIGGRVTAEVLAQSALEGLRLVALLACFGTFLAVTDVHRVLRLMPRFLAEAGLVVTIGLAFAPSILRSAAEVRDAQRLRGHRARGIRGAVPLVVPVLAGALERAVTLAESMESRGYGRVADGLHRDEALARAGVLASLISLATGLGLVVFGRGPLALRWVMLGAAAAGTGASLRALSRLVPRTRFRPERLDGFDGALAAGSVAVAAAVAAAARGPGGRWYAYPSVSWPVLDAGTVALAACVALPVALAAARAARLARASRRAIVPQGARA